MPDAPATQSFEALRHEHGMREKWQRPPPFLFSSGSTEPNSDIGLASVQQHPEFQPVENIRQLGTSGTAENQFRVDQTSELRIPEPDTQGGDGVLGRQYNAATKPKGIMEAFINTCQRWQLTADQRLVLLGLRGADPVGQLLLLGVVRVRLRDQEARIRYVLLISLGLEILFNNDIDAEIVWLTYPRAELGKSSPLDHMLKGDIVHLLTVSEIVKRERGL